MYLPTNKGLVENHLNDTIFNFEYSLVDNIYRLAIKGDLVLAITCSSTFPPTCKYKLSGVQSKILCN